MNRIAMCIIYTESYVCLVVDIRVCDQQQYVSAGTHFVDT